MKKLLLIFLIIPNFLFSQSQMLNGIDINGPNGYIKVDDLTWVKGNDILAILSFKQNKDEYSKEYFKKTCENATRTTEFHSLQNFEMNGINYQICYQIGENKMLIGQVAVFRGDFTYVINIGIYMLDYEEPNQIIKSLKEAEFNLGYMISRILIF